MENILRKRVFRNLKSNFIRYFALFVLISLSMYMVTSLVLSAENIIKSVEKSNQINILEDGQFSVFTPIEDEKIDRIKKKGITLEEMFYMDYTLKEDSTIRIYKNRENINRINLIEGQLAQNKGELVIEKHYAKNHNLSIKDKINIRGNIFEITGISSTPDYDLVLKNIYDTTVESSIFATAFVSDDQYEDLRLEKKASKSEEYVYAYLLNSKMTDKELKDYLIDISKINIIQFLQKDDNPRIKASVGDVVINKQIGIIAGVIVMIMLTFVISVFVINEIEKENMIIGSMYAQGIKKKELIKHYLTLPIIITFIGGFVGTLIGFSKIGVEVIQSSTLSYFSLPTIQQTFPTYLILYGILMPPITAIITNYIVINKKLSQSVLSLIRNEQKLNKKSNINLSKLSYIHTFQIRQFLREKRISIVLIFGMFISLLILMVGLNCYALSINIIDQNQKDTRFQYMYTYKYPSKEIPKEVEIAYIENLKSEIYGYKQNVSLLGVYNDNHYFDYNIKPGKNKVVISNSVAQKYNLKINEKLILTDEINEQDYAFTIEKIVPYSVGLYVFMDIDSMRELFQKDEEYYNVVYSDKKLDVKEEILYSTTTKKDIEKASYVFLDQMKPMIIIMITISSIIFIVVMYLMIKVVIDKAAFNISLLKIFGYRKKEIKKLYLDGNLILVLVSSIINILLSKFIMDKIYPYLIANVACGVDMSFKWHMYLAIYIGIIVCYLLINFLLVNKISKLSPSDVLKNRE